MLSLASLQQGGKLLEQLDQDGLLSWVAVVMLALDMVGVPLAPEGEQRRRRRQDEGGSAEDTSGMSVGLKARAVACMLVLARRWAAGAALAARWLRARAPPSCPASHTHTYSLTHAGVCQGGGGSVPGWHRSLPPPAAAEHGGCGLLRRRRLLRTLCQPCCVQPVVAAGHAASCGRCAGLPDQLACLCLPLRGRR